MNKHLICEKCGGKTQTKFVDKNIFHKGREFPVKNIKAEVCSNCGERYFSVNVLLEIENRIEQDQYKKAA